MVPSHGAMSITLYFTPRSSSTMVHWALEELGLPYERHRIDLAAGEQKRPDFLALNPNGKVPALVVDGVAMFESLAMLHYLGERFGVARNLWPEHACPDYPVALSWSVWSAVTLSPAIFRAAQEPEARPELGRLLAMLDAHLADRPWAAAGRFTLVDIALSSKLSVAQHFKLVDEAAYPNLARWLARCLERPDRATAVKE